MDVKLCTPTPVEGVEELPAPWVSQTPHNPTEASSQSEFIKNRISRHQGSSPTSTLHAVDQFAKETQGIMHQMALLRSENQILRQENEILSRGRRAKKKRLQQGGSLTLAEGQGLQDQKEVDVQLEEESRRNGGRRRRPETKERRCGVGEPKGKHITVANNIEAYIATPPADKAKKDVGVLFITDVLGIYNNNQLLADEFAANGYTCLLPDVLSGDKIPSSPPADFDIVDWINNGTDRKSPHTPQVIDPIIIEGIKKLKELGITKIGAVGYCFGAKYVVRHYQNGIQAGYIAHPSFIDEHELAAITGPLSIAAAQTDAIFPAHMRHRSEEILIQTGLPFQINLFSGVEHGFAVRGDPTVQVQRFAKEHAFYQAIAWFDEYLL
ncbi:hypothetical protein FOQG_18531 [Fusarium oxysporum f. sp. raphani 54005]|uniref:Dienelactone hydrolase domain-containing protein n=1 Tax=Fusarium oxysporum f. sp. raphani 54005 TaxID=1089458 RepID=X0BE53_FUSOX|nr:hypothetical protein FOQG_18531 [Fusarium oxysporum f. sp. raphani 54005]